MTPNYCPDCGEGLKQYGEPTFCPECGTEVDGPDEESLEQPTHSDIEAAKNDNTGSKESIHDAIEKAEEFEENRRPPAETAEEVVERHGYLLEPMAKRDDDYGAIARAALKAADNHSYDGGQL